MCSSCDDTKSTLSRRGFLCASATLAALAASVPEPSHAANQTIPSGSFDDVLKSLQDGNERHASGVQTCTEFLKTRAALAAQQSPRAVVIGCSDSRVAPEYVFDQGPGELFVVRIAGNYVDDAGLASLEYAVGHLKTPIIVVLSHSSCGAVTAAVEAQENRTSLPGLLPLLAMGLNEPVNQALATHPKDPVAAAIRQNVVHNIARLNTIPSEVKEGVTHGTVKIVGGVYDLSSGIVTFV